MSTTSKIKWMGTILLVGIILALALMGGKWGTSYAADGGVNIPPTIYKLDPDAAPVGSPDKYISISGKDFGDITNTAVRVRGTAIDIYLIPEEVLPDGLSVIFPSFLFVDDTFYLVTVVIYPGTIPTIPPVEESNPLTFKVYIPKLTYLPFAKR